MIDDVDQHFPGEGDSTLVSLATPGDYVQDRMILDLEGGGSIQTATAEATSSVLLRDKAGKLEHAD